MTSKERRFYLLAFFVSLALHAAFLVIYIPHKLLDKPVEIDTFAVGVVEMPFGNAAVGPQALIAAVAPATVNLPAHLKPTLPASGKPNAVAVKPTAAATEKAPEKPAEPLIVPTHPDQTKPSKPADTAVNPTDKPLSGDKEGTGPKNNDAKGTDDNNGPGKGDGGPGGPGGPGTAPFVASSLGTGEQMYSGGGGGFPYPKNLLNEGKEGDVEVQFFIRTDGSLEKYEMIRATGDSGLIKPVKTYIERQLKKSWKPYNQNYYINVLFSFKSSTGNVKIILEKSETRP